MFKDLYPATWRAAKAYMEKHGQRVPIAPVTTEDGVQPSADTAAVDGTPLRLTIELPPEAVSEIMIRFGGPAAC